MIELPVHQFQKLALVKFCVALVAYRLLIKQTKQHHVLHWVAMHTYSKKTPLHRTLLAITHYKNFLLKKLQGIRVKPV
jgi:hypothetical protein